MKNIHEPAFSTAFSVNQKKAKGRFENILSGKKSRSLFLIVILLIAMFSSELLLSCTAKLEKEQISLTKEEATELLRDELIKAYEITYGEYIPLSEDPSPTDDREYLRYAISNLYLSGEDERFYKFSVIFEFWVEKSTGDIYKYYNGLDKTLTLFDPEDKYSLHFAG